MTRLPIFATLTLAASLAWAPAAMAQTQQQRQPPAKQPPPAAQQQQSYGEDELKSYASARLEVQRLNQTYQPQIRAAGSPQKQQQIQQQALQKMASAVRAQGLSVEKYNEISQAVQANPQLASQVQGYIDEGK